MVSLKEETADCLLRAVCEANEDSSLAGEVAREAVEVGSFLLLSVLPLESSLITDMVMAARVGRVNYGTSRLGERDSPVLRLSYFQDRDCVRGSTMAVRHITNPPPSHVTL